MTTNKLNILFTVVFLSFSFAVSSQGGRLLRQEIDAADYDFLYFIPLEERGLLTLQHSVHFKSGNDFWEINRYSKHLKLLDKTKFTTGPGHMLIEYDDDGDSLFYGFFAEKEGSRKYEIIKYNYLSGKLSKITGAGESRTVCKHFDVVGKTGFVAGIKEASAGAYFLQTLYSITLIPAFTGSKVYDIQPQIFYNSTSGKSGKITLELKGESVIFATGANPKTRAYSLIIKNIYKRKSTLYYYEFDENGKKIRQTVLPRLNERNLLSGQLILTGDSSLAFVGTYNNDKRHSFSTNVQTTGIFVSTLKEGKESIVKFHPFSEFTNAKKALDFRTLQRFENSKRKGENIDLGFNLLMHNDIINIDSVHLLIAESYYPEYHYETYSNFYGSMYSDQIFDGYRFNYAFAAAFNDAGDLLWDNTFKMSNIISYNLDENVIVYFDGTTEVFLYYFDGKIYSKVISGNEIVYREEETEVRTVNNNEEVLYENYGKIYHWYGPYFLLTGYQVVVDSRAKKRKVYFFLKLKFG